MMIDVTFFESGINMFQRNAWEFSTRNDVPIFWRNPMCSTSPTLRPSAGPLELLPRSNGPGFVFKCSAVPSHYAILIQQQKNGWTVTGLILLSPKNRMGKSIWLKLYLPLVELGYKKKQRRTLRRKAIHFHHRLVYSVSIFRNKRGWRWCDLCFLDYYRLVLESSTVIWSTLQHMERICSQTMLESYFSSPFHIPKVSISFQFQWSSKQQLNTLSHSCFILSVRVRLPQTRVFWRSSN